MKKIPLVLLIIAFGSTLSTYSAKAVDINKVISRFNLESKLNQRSKTIEESINSLGTDLKDGINAVKSEIDNEISKYKDIIGRGEQIADLVTKNHSISKGEVAKSVWNNLSVREQVRDVLGETGQTKTQQENKQALESVKQTEQMAFDAQTERITQEIAKKQIEATASQTAVLQLIQSTLQEQKELEATGNVVLSDISTQINNQRQQQLEEREAIRNAISANSSYRTKLRSYGVSR